MDDYLLTCLVTTVDDDVFDGILLTGSHYKCVNRKSLLYKIRDNKPWFAS